MPQILDLPPETLILIFDWLELQDQFSLYVAQGVCRLFRTIIERKPSAVLESRFDPVPPPSHPDDSPPFEYVPYKGRVNEKAEQRRREKVDFLPPVLRDRFGVLFNTARRAPNPDSIPDCLRKNIMEELPWADDAASREPYLRPEASWRRLRITARPEEPTPIRRLDFCMGSSSWGAMHMEYARADLPSTPDGIGLTMGRFFDMVASHQVNGQNWRLYPGKKLWSFDEWTEVGATGRGTNKTAMLGLLVDDPAAATLLTTSYYGCVSGVHLTNEQVAKLEARPEPWWPKPLDEQSRLETKPWEKCGPHPPARPGAVAAWQEWHNGYEQTVFASVRKRIHRMQKGKAFSSEEDDSDTDSEQN